MKNGAPFDVTLTFESDWIVGTGRGRHGGLDEVVARDGDDLPYVPGTTAIGMVRDGAEAVAYALDGGSDRGGWNRWVHALFGGQAVDDHPPRRGCLDTRALRLPAAVREQLVGGDPAGPRAILRRALVVTRAGVALDPTTHAARTNMLRFGERGRAGLALESTWTLAIPELPTDAEIPWPAELLLLAGMKLVDHIGAHRRRGAGHCCLTTGQDHQRRLQQLLKEHEQDLDDPGDPDAVLSGFETAEAEARTESAGDTVVSLTIELLSPLVATDTTVGNAVRTLPYLPGTTLLPLVQRAFGRLGPLLLRGGLVVTDATPEIHGQRSLPTPLALQLGKRTNPAPGAPLYVVTRAEAPEDSRPTPVGGFVVESAGAARIGRPTLVTLAHAVVDDGPQRPTENSGGLFTYQSIAPGTVLRAEIRFPGSRPANLSDALTTLTGIHSLGRSRKDEYGQVRIQAEESTPPSARTFGARDELVLLLASDTILPDDPARATPPDQLAALLSARLRVELAAIRDGELPGALIRPFRRESWQSRWQLPRPSVSGLAAGSVIRFAVRSGLETAERRDGFAERVRELELTGIGGRTAEGFGQVVVDHPLLSADTVPIADPPRNPASPTPGTGADSPGLPGWWAVVAQAAWRSEITERAVAAAMQKRTRVAVLGDTGRLTASQLGTLRLVATGADTEFRDRLNDWWRRVPEGRKPEWSSFGRQILTGDQALDHLELPPDAVPADLSQFAAQQLLLALLRTARGRDHVESAEGTTGE